MTPLYPSSRYLANLCRRRDHFRLHCSLLWPCIWWADCAFVPSIILRCCICIGFGSEDAVYRRWLVRLPKWDLDRVTRGLACTQQFFSTHAEVGKLCGERVLIDAAQMRHIRSATLVHIFGAHFTFHALLAQTLWVTQYQIMQRMSDQQLYRFHTVFFTRMSNKKNVPTTMIHSDRRMLVTCTCAAWICIQRWSAKIRDVRRLWKISQWMKTKIPIRCVAIATLNRRSKSSFTARVLARDGSAPGHGARTLSWHALCSVNAQSSHWYPCFPKPQRNFLHSPQNVGCRKNRA